MSLAPPEELLALLVASPQGLRLGERTAEAAAALAARGHPLRQTATGCRLECAAVHFDPAAFAAAGAGRFGARLEVWERAESTNDLAHAGAAAGAPDGSGWLAEAQTHGRGRQGRTWICAPHAGLLVSWLVRGPLALALQPTLLPLALGLGACEGLRQATGLAVRTKWPNDLWLGERKLAGLLVEARPGVAPYAVVGFGLNVGVGAMQDTDLPHAATLAGAGRVLPRREVLLAAIALGVERRLVDWRAGRGAAVLQAWQAQDVSIGRQVRVETAAGELTGCVQGVSAAGLLRLETARGVRHELAAGEVHFL